MRKLIVSLIFGLMAPWMAAGPAAGADLNLQPFTNFIFNDPIGIDFHQPTGNVIMSVFYPSGSPHNLDTVSPGGTPTQFSTLSGRTEELKIATVRNEGNACQPGFKVGEVFTANGVPGQIVRISPGGGGEIGGYLLNPWVALGGTDLLRGSFFQDRFCVAGGDLIVLTSNEQPDASVGNVYRVTSAGAATLVGTTNTHLEGATTVPNIPALHGPLAGRILAGAEDLFFSGTTPLYGPNGRIYAFNPNPPHDFFTVGAGSGPSCTSPYTAAQSGCNFPTATPFHPEDLDVIRKDADFFGIDFGGGKVLKAMSTDLSASNFRDRCGQVLITQELVDTGTSGLFAMRWDAATSAFIVDPLTLAAGSAAVGHWEHVTFTSGADCSTTINIVKTPDNATFNVGDQLTFTLVVSNTGPTTANNVKLDDPLPTTGGLTWTVFSTTAGTCNAIPTSGVNNGVLHCDLGDIAPNGSVTVVVKSSNVGGAPAGACTGQKLDNIGTASATNATSVTDHGDYTCTPLPHLKVVKTPDGGTFTQGGAVSFTIVVSNDGTAGSVAANAQLSDQLPTAGGLNWSGATVTTSQGTCSVSATSLLTCSFGSINAGSSVTVTVSLASTPAAACQSQPNPHAIATANGGLSAEDAGSLTCTPPPGGLIAPTQTTCQDFRDGTASALGQINYPVSGGKIGQGINPGVFFYYTRITTTVPNQVVTVSESQNDAAALFQTHSDGRLYTLACSSWTAGTDINGDTGVSFTIATPGTYIISVKYDTKTIAGTNAPTSDPVTYTFTTSLGASTSGSVLLKLK